MFIKHSVAFNIAISYMDFSHFGPYYHLSSKLVSTYIYVTACTMFYLIWNSCEMLKIPCLS